MQPRLDCGHGKSLLMFGSESCLSCSGCEGYDDWRCCIVLFRSAFQSKTMVDVHYEVIVCGNEVDEVFQRFFRFGIMVRDIPDEDLGFGVSVSLWSTVEEGVFRPYVIFFFWLLLLVLLLFCYRSWCRWFRRFLDSLWLWNFFRGRPLLCVHTLNMCFKLCDVVFCSSQRRSCLAYNLLETVDFHTQLSDIFLAGSFDLGVCILCSGYHGFCSP